MLAEYLKWLTEKGIDQGYIVLDSSEYVIRVRCPGDDRPNTSLWKNELAILKKRIFPYVDTGVMKWIAPDLHARQNGLGQWFRDQNGAFFFQPALNASVADVLHEVSVVFRAEHAAHEAALLAVAT